MSPTKAFKERSVRGAEGSGNSYVKVGIESNMVQVRWLCGGDRAFTAENLREAIDYVRGLGAKYDMWFELKDSHHVSYHVRLKDGKLTANDRFGENGFVEWSQLLPELEAALTHLSTHE